MKRRALILCLLCAACATPEQIEAQRQMQEQADFDTCVSYGLQPGSENFGMCLLELDLARQERYNRATYYGGYGYHHRHSRAGSYIGLGF